MSQLSFTENTWLVHFDRLSSHFDLFHREPSAGLVKNDWLRLRDLKNFRHHACKVANIGLGSSVNYISYVTLFAEFYCWECKYCFKQKG